MMDKIKSECNGIDLNLGFIGYKDIVEIFNKDYLIINFTQNYFHVKEEISKIKVGGGDDTAENIAWAFEEALKLNWESKAKVVFLVADGPCHGIEYHEKDLYDNYPYEIPKKKNKKFS